MSTASWQSCPDLMRAVWHGEKKVSIRMQWRKKSSLGNAAVVTQSFWTYDGSKLLRQVPDPLQVSARLQVVFVWSPQGSPLLVEHWGQVRMSDGTSSDERRQTISVDKNGKVFISWVSMWWVVKRSKQKCKTYFSTSHMRRAFRLSFRSSRDTLSGILNGHVTLEQKGKL